MLNKQKITKTHDLVELLDDCISVRNDLDFETLRDNCQTLTRYRTEFVYPAPTPEWITVEEASQAIEQARLIYQFSLSRAIEQGYSEV